MRFGPSSGQAKERHGRRWPRRRYAATPGPGSPSTPIRSSYLCWLVGERDAGCANVVHAGPSAPLANRVQLTTDGHKVTKRRDGTFADEIDYANSSKIYGNEPEKARSGTARRMPGCKKKHRSASPTRSTQHDLCGAPEPHDADVHAPVHPADERLLKED